MAGAVVLIGMGVVVATLIGSGGPAASGPGSFHAHGIAFSYPSTWTRYPDAHLQYNAGAAPRSTEGFGPTSTDGIVVATYGLARPVGPTDLPDLRRLFEGLVQNLAAEGGGRVLSGPDDVTVAGLPGFRFRITISLGGTLAENRLLVLFEDDTEYLFTCQHTPAFAAEVERGCDQVEATLRPD